LKIQLVSCLLTFDPIINLVIKLVINNLPKLVFDFLITDYIDNCLVLKFQKSNKLPQ
jgi:hypothetical protein